MTKQPIIPSQSLNRLMAISALALIVCTSHADDDPMSQCKMPVVQLPKIPPRTFNITNYGAVPDGKTINTDSIANAINTLSDKGGGRLVIPAGIWLTGPIELKSKIQLHVEEGALVLFTPDHSRYPERSLDMKGRPVTRTMSPIFGQHLEDIAITGRGVFDANGSAWRPVKKMKMTDGQWKKLLATPGSVLESNDTLWWPSAEAAKDRRPTLLKLVNCRRILLEDATFQNSPGWNLNPTLCDDITIRNITVRNPWYSQNGDGLDLENCRNVILRDSRFDVGDDAICLKSGKDAEGRRIAVATENILIENCVVYHGHGGVVIGSEMSSGVRNVRVDNCTFIGTDLGLRFKSTRGRGGVVEKIFISNIRMTDIPTEAIGFNLYYGGQTPTEAGNGSPTETKAIPVTEETPQFRDIWIQNVVCRGAKQAVALQGLPEMPIRGIHLKNVSITSELGVACTDAQNITLENVEILNTTGPVVSLTASRDIQINGLTYTAGAETVFKAQGTNNARIIIENTDLKSAKRNFTLSNGASKEAFKAD